MHKDRTSVSKLNMKIWHFAILLLLIFPRSTLGKNCEPQQIKGSPLDDCDIFEEELILKMERIVKNPKCLVEMAIEIGGKKWRFKNPGGKRTVKNMIKDKCQKTSFTIMTEDKAGKKKIKTFELDPEKCIEENINAANVSFGIAGEKKIRVHVKSGLVKKPNMQECLKRVEIRKLEGEARIKTVYQKKGMTIDLDRTQKQMLLLEYQLKNSTKLITRGLSVPRAGTPSF